MSDWCETTWGEIGTLEYGRALRGYESGHGHVRVYGTNGPVGWTVESQSSGPGVIIGRKGAYRGVHYSPGPFWVIDTAFYLKPIVPLDIRWSYYSLRNTDINSLDSGSAIPSTSRADFYAIPVDLPTLVDQRAIANLLGVLDDKIAVNDRILGTYEQLLRMRFEELRIDEDPDSSPMVTASELIEFNPAVPVPRSGDVVYLDMAAVPTDRATVLEWSRREPKSGTRFTNGDTVMARITPCLENGKTAFIDFMEDGEVGVGSTEFIVMRARPRIPAHLPYFLARSPRFRGYAVQNMVGSSGRQRVNAVQLVDFPLRRPDCDDLSSFDTTVRAAFAHMRSLTDESRNLADLRDTLLPKLMSGEIRVRDAEKAVEDVT